MLKLSDMPLLGFLMRLLTSKRRLTLTTALCLSTLAFTALQQPSIAADTQVSSILQLAQRRRRSYRPPADAQIPRRNHSGGGVRGCGEEIAAIAPRLSSIGQTLESHPTLVWYNYSNNAEPLELHLYRYPSDGAGDESIERVFIKKVGNSQQGYMSYTLPDSEPGLQVGEIYFWQVVLYCDPNLEEVGMWTAADIQRVSDAAGVAAQLSGDAMSDAQMYADAGLWYEAIALLNTLSTPAADNLRRDMLMDLADLESETDTEATVSIVEQLRRIAEE